MILYICKIFIGLCTNSGLEIFPFNACTGDKVEIKLSLKAEKWVQKPGNSSFFSLAPTLFNALPLELRSFTLPETPTKKHVEEYKHKLDK